MSIVFRVSRSPVGSSNKRICGSFAKALAIVTRCCSPPDSSEGRWSMRSCNPTKVSNSFARCFIALLESLFKIVIGSITFS
mmetsp:Transcript_2468/g.3782  ORF Transcript_2468/g.3782 Transcript_2468/m.3782 type:complete len:81 (+) Transcript_2468:1573-1815(+)